MSSLPLAASFFTSQENSLQVEGKVELPRRALWRVAILVTQRQTQLDYTQHIDVTPHRLEVVVGPGLEIAYWAGYYAWKLGVLCVSLCLGIAGSTEIGATLKADAD
jgi:hypothetical protein